VGREVSRAGSTVNGGQHEVRAEEGRCSVAVVSAESAEWSSPSEGQPAGGLV
jgi:hypothetical protein